MSDEAIELTRRFTDAFNARDAEKIRALVSDAVQMVGPDGNKVTGFVGSRVLLEAATRTNVRLVRTGDEQVDRGEESTEIVVPLRVSGADGERQATGRFEIAEEKISSFRVETGEED